MEIQFKLTEKERTFLAWLVKNDNHISSHPQYDGIKKEHKREFDTFCKSGILYHSNVGSESYVRYELTAIGKQIAKNASDVTSVDPEQNELCRESIDAASRAVHAWDNFDDGGT